MSGSEPVREHDAARRLPAAPLFRDRAVRDIADKIGSACSCSDPEFGGEPVSGGHAGPDISSLGGEALVISLGCEKLQAEQVMHEGDPSVDLRDPWLYRLQESNTGFGEMIEQIMALAETRLKKLDQRRREPELRDMARELASEGRRRKPKARK